MLNTEELMCDSLATENQNEKPFDFQIIEEKLKANKYATPYEFANDVRLIFENSKKVNPDPESEIYKKTERLSLIFENGIEDIFTFYEFTKHWVYYSCQTELL